MNTNIRIVSTRLDCRESSQMSLQAWLGGSATPPHVITVEAMVPPEFDRLTASLVVEELIKPQLPQLLQPYSNHEFAGVEWWVDNCYDRSSETPTIKHNGVYRNREALQPTSSNCGVSTFNLIPRIYAEMSHFQRSLWTLELPYLSIQGVPIYRMWTDWDSKTGDVLYLHLKSREAIPDIAVEAIYNWFHLGTPIDLTEVGVIAQRHYLTHIGSGTIHNLEIATPLNGTELLVGNIITPEGSSTSSAEPSAPIPSCLNCAHFYPGTADTPTQPGLDPECIHPDRENFSTVDPDAEDAAIDLGGDARWELYAQDCPGYKQQEPSSPTGSSTATPLPLPQQADWVLPDKLLAQQGPDLMEYLEELKVHKQKFIQQATDRSPLPKFTTIIVNTPEGDRTFQFNGAHINELVATKGKVKQVEVRSPKGELWYDQAHLEVMQCLHDLENAIRRMQCLHEESWDEEPDFEDFGVPIVGIDPDAPECQQMFE